MGRRNSSSVPDLSQGVREALARRDLEDNACLITKHLEDNLRKD